MDAVPVFLAGTYDHDLAEVNHVALPGTDGTLQTLATSAHGVPGAPVGSIQFGDEINPLVEQAVSLLGDCEVATFLRECYRPGENLGHCFRTILCAGLCRWGVIVLDASDPELSAIAEPIYRTAIEESEETWLLRCSLEVRNWKRRDITSK